MLIVLSITPSLLLIILLFLVSFQLYLVLLILLLFTLRLILSLRSGSLTRSPLFSTAVMCLTGKLLSISLSGLRMLLPLKLFPLLGLIFLSRILLDGTLYRRLCVAGVPTLRLFYSRFTTGLLGLSGVDDCRGSSLFFVE